MMQLLLLSFILLFFSGCMQTPELSASKGIVAQDQIAINKTEAQKAKEEYVTLQEKRTSDYGS